MCVLLMQENKETEVMQMAQHMNQTVIFQPERYKVRLYLVTLCTSLRVGKSEILTDSPKTYL
jgi:hypothetical protein